MGGMAAQIPIAGDPSANELALAKVRADKVREASDGHDGTWVAHPGLVPIARAIFDEGMPGPNQIERADDGVRVTERDLLEVPEGTRTDEGLRHNVRVGIQYIESWLMGQGCVPLYDLMEDAATAEISRSQVWQWMHHGAPVGGRLLDEARLRGVIAEEMRRIEREVGAERFARGRFPEAERLFVELATAPQLHDFLTPLAYELI
jgi:malate synthase